MNATKIKTILSILLALILAGGLIFCLILSLRNQNVLLGQDQTILALQEELSQEKKLSESLELSIKEINSKLDKTATTQAQALSQLNDLTKKNNLLQQKIQNTKEQQSAAQKESKEWQVEYVTTLIKMENSLKGSEEQIVLLKKDFELLKIELDAIDINEIRQQILQLKQNLETMARAFSSRGANYIPQSLHPDLLQN